MASSKMTALDRVLLAVSPSWALARFRARAAAMVLARHYEAAQPGRRTQGWPRPGSDANAAAGAALSILRMHARDLVRNNGWARNGVRIITRHTVGYGLQAKPMGVEKSADLVKAWTRWAGTTQADAAGRLTFGGLQKLVMRTVVESGEVLIRRRWRRPEDGLALPVQLQVLEPDFLDPAKHNISGDLPGSYTIYGIEFDALGRRKAYWLYDKHPGSVLASGLTSRRIPATEILHVYDVERAGQDRGVSWLATPTVNLKDFDEFEDAQLMRQKIAACFAAFETNVDGDASSLGATDAADPGVETLEPGMIAKLTPGRDVKFANPPLVTDDGFSVRTLRRIAAAIGVTYEDLTGDYSQVNFSSARMSRLAHWANVSDWQWNMLVPQFCTPAWGWAMEAAATAGLASAADPPAAEWTEQPMPMIEPDREARANLTMMRSGQKTLPQVLREQGIDPETHIQEIADTNALLDRLGVWLDSDPRRVSQAGLTQERAGAGASGKPANGAANGSGPGAEDEEEDPAAAAETTQ